MKASNALSTLRVVTIAFGMIVAFGIPTFGQEVSPQNEAAAPKPAPAMNEVLRHNIEDWVLQGRGIPQDWSHHHLVFSNPGTEEDAIANGTHDRWLNIVNDPRYIIQQLKRRAAPGPAAMDIASIEQTAQAGNAASAGTIAAIQDPTPAAKSKKKSKMKKDWSEVLASGATATGTGTVSSNNAGNGSTFSVGGQTFTASNPVAASATGTFSSTGPTNTQTATITDGANALKLTASASSSTGTVNNRQASGADPGDTVTIGGVVYEFQDTQADCSGSYNVCVWYGTNAFTGNTQVAESLEAAINNNTTECPSPVAGTWGSTCYTVVTAGDAPNPAASATRATHTVTVTNLTNTTLAVSTNDAGTFTVSGNVLQGTQSGCTAATAGTFVIDGNSTTQQATNLAAAINACHTSFSAVGVTASSSAATVTVTAATAGSSGNNIALAETLSNFTWSGTDLGGGSDGTNSGTTFAYWSGAAAASTSQLATNIAAAIDANTTLQASTGVSAIPTSSTVNLTARSAGTAGNSIATPAPSFSGFHWGGGTLGGGTNTTATLQPNMYPATYVASLTSASCSDLAVYPTGHAGSASAANIIAYNNLYVGSGACQPTDPTVYWAYNTGAYAVTTSPILSVDGTQIAFIESNGATASLVLLKWAPSPTPPTGVTGSFLNASTTVLIASGTVTAADVGMQISGAGIPANDTIVSVTGPSLTLAAATTAASSGVEALTITAETITTPGVAPTVSNASYRSCTAPCMTTVAFTNGKNDTLSAPFYDFFADDALYVGDDSGNLHRFTGVFAGNPAEAGSPWPVNLGTNKLSSPVYDSNSGHVIVGDMGGALHSVTATGTVFTAAGLGDAIADAPMVDGTSGILFAFVTTSGAYSWTGYNAVYEFSTGFTTFGFPGVEPVGTGGAGYYLYAGDFDNVYYESSSPPSGSLYVVGNTGATTGGILYRIPITGGGMTGSTAGPTITSAAHPWPSPATEFCNNGASPCAVSTGLPNCPSGVTCTSSGTDYLFFSVYRGTVASCTNAAGVGCILSYNISNPSAPVHAGNGLNVTTPGTPGCWATGGILPDNSATTTGASQIYFVNLNGAAAGGAGGGTPTSTNCAAGATGAIYATQAQQSSP